MSLDLTLFNSPIKDEAEFRRRLSLLIKQVSKEILRGNSLMTRLEALIGATPPSTKPSGLTEWDDANGVHFRLTVVKGYVVSLTQNGVEQLS